MNSIIVRYGELALKGGNRQIFEKKLVRNIRKCLAANNISFSINKLRGRIFVQSSDPLAIKCLRRVFGIVSISPAFELEKDIEKFKLFLQPYITELQKKQDIVKFRISARRADKNFPITSQDIAIDLGNFVCDNFSLKVSLKQPDLNIGLEIHDKLYFYHETIKCFGGLPLGISGRVACLLENKQDILAAWLMMKRGCAIYPVAFTEFDISLLESFAYGQKIKLHLLTESELSEFVSVNSCSALVIGSTFEAFNPVRFSGLVLTPLIAYSEEEITDKLKSISDAI